MVEWVFIFWILVVLLLVSDRIGAVVLWWRGGAMRFIEHIRRNDEQPYLTRYHLLHTPWFRIYLHRFVDGDGACLHDHPWAWWTSVVLWGGYVERSAYRFRGSGRLYGWSSQSRPAGSVACHGRGWIHSIVELYRIPTWTLMVVGQKVRPWGFYTLKGWIPWHRYSESRDC